MGLKHAQPSPTACPSQAKVKLAVLLGEFKSKRAASIHYTNPKYFQDSHAAEEFARMRLNRDVMLAAPNPKETNIGGHRYLAG